MHNTIIVRYGEIALKGKNRIDFERKLVINIKDCLKKNEKKFDFVNRKRGRIFIDTDEKCYKLSRVFGITSFSYAKKEKFDIEKIKHTIYEFLNNMDFMSFRVSAHRTDKTIKTSSQKLNISLGQFIVDSFKKKVSLKDYDVNVGVEIFEGNSYTYINQIEGPAGLPCGVNGTAIAIIKNKKSLLAAWLMMKRGLRIIPVADNESDISLLEKYNYGNRSLKLNILKNNMGIEAFAKDKSIFSLITGDTVGDFEDFSPDFLVLRPLVGFDNDQILKKLKNL